MNIEQLNNNGPNIGYYFLLLAVSLLISAVTAILYTDWWTKMAFAWRGLIQPGHNCQPRELSVTHLLWITVVWFFRDKVFCGLRAKMKRRKTGEGHSVDV